MIVPGALAVSTPVVTLWANPREALEHPEQWSRLAGNSVVTQKDFARKVRRHESREFVYLERGLAPETTKQVLDLNIPGIHSLTEYRRYYPAGEVSSHVVGFTNIDDEARDELAMDDHLSGHSGRRRWSAICWGVSSRISRCWSRQSPVKISP